MLKIEAIAKNFKIFWSLQVRMCLYVYRMLRTCKKLEMLHHSNHSTTSKPVFPEVKVNTYTNLKNSENRYTEKGNASPYSRSLKKLVLKSKLMTKLNS